MSRNSQRLASPFLGLFALFLWISGIAVVTAGYWPGIMIDDTRWQYQQALDNAYEDWHPPLMAWIWRQLALIHPGPAPMLVLQLALYWIGIALFAWWARATGRPKLAVAFVLVGWIPAPLALCGTITKDGLMAGALGCSAGLLYIRTLAQSRAARAAYSAGAIFFIALAAALRFNAAIACVPLLLVALPASFTRTKTRLAVTAVAGSLSLIAIGPLINISLNAEKTDVGLSLIIFDLGGITEHSGVSQFPDLNLRDPVAINHRCYDPNMWDTYSSWARTPCQLGFDAIQSAKDNGDADPFKLWASAVEHHPLAYAEHRLTHFNLSTDFMVATGPVFTAWVQSVDNPWGYRVPRNPILASVSHATIVAEHTPIGWPVFWIAVALAALVAGVLMRAPPAAIAVAASSLLYGLSYLVVGVSIGMRYYLWTITGAGLAAVVVAGLLIEQGKMANRLAITSALAIVAVPTSLACLARVLL